MSYHQIDFFGPKEDPEIPGLYCDDPSWRVMQPHESLSVFHRECTNNQCDHCEAHPMTVQSPIIPCGDAWMVIGG